MDRDVVAVRYTASAAPEYLIGMHCRSSFAEAYAEANI